MRKKHPEVWVDLRSEGGPLDRFVIVGRVTQAMRQRAMPEGEIQEFREATYKAKTPDELLALIDQWVEVSK